MLVLTRKLGEKIAIGQHAEMLITGVKMFLIKTDPQDPHDKIVVDLVRRLIPITDKYH